MILVPQTSIGEVDESLKITIEAYQLFLVEQWAAKRSRVIKTVVAYTGVESHQVQLYPCQLQDDENEARFMEKFESDTFVNDDSTSIKRKWVDLKKSRGDGKLLVTSISTIPASLNLLQVPEGDYERFIDLYFFNYNLQKLGCGGRNSATFDPLQTAQKDMFIQTYLIFDNKNVTDALFNMVKLIQVSLFLINTLAVDYADGLFCDETVAGIDKFVELFRYHDLVATNMESVCPPALLSALLSKILTYRNLLYAAGIQVSKNPFGDLDNFRSSICAFQRIHKIDQTGVFDEKTVLQLEDTYEDIRKPASSSSKSKVSKLLKGRFDETFVPNDLVLEIEDLNVLLANVNCDAFRTVWGKKPRVTTSDLLLNSGTLAEGLINGGKEFGQKLKHLHASDSEDVSSQSVKRLMSMPDINDYTLDIETTENEKLVGQYQLLCAKEKQLNESILSITDVSRVLAQKIHTISAVYANNWQMYGELDTLYTQLKETHQHLLEKISLLQLNNSRIHYEISVIEEKINEANDTMDNFRNKSDELADTVESGIEFTSKFGIIDMIRAAFRFG